MNEDHFAARLKELRIDNGWTQQELADRAGFTVGFIRDVEQGRRSPSWKAALHLANVSTIAVGAFTVQPPPRSTSKGQAATWPTAATASPGGTGARPPEATQRQRSPIASVRG